MRTRRAAVCSPWAPALVVLVAIATDVGAAAVGPDPAVADDSTTTAVQGSAEGRGHFKDMMMNPYMLIPQLISLGFAPIVLANLKMLVMNALMINNMALNAAIFMTVRNMVFGPRPKVKYVNYGYRDGHHRDDGHPQHQQHHQHHHDPLEQQQQQQLTEEEAQMAEYRRRRRTYVVGS